MRASTLRCGSELISPRPQPQQQDRVPRQSPERLWPAVTGAEMLELTQCTEQERTLIRTVHVFQCGSADLFGLTRDQTGANLPTDECTDGWRFVRTVEMDEGLPPRGMSVAWQEREAAVRAALANTGYFVGEAGALPSEFE